MLRHGNPGPPGSLRREGGRRGGAAGSIAFLLLASENVRDFSHSRLLRESDRAIPSVTALEYETPYLPDRCRLASAHPQCHLADLHAGHAAQRASGEAFGSFALPAWATIGFGVFVQLVTIAAAIGILKGQRWGRNTYLGISVLGLLVGSFNLPSVGMLIPGLVVFLIVAFFLLRASATAYFNRTTAA